jgi:hypothetical protein
MSCRVSGCWPLLAFICLFLVAPGCGSSGPRVVKVSGTVTRDGQPVNKLFLNFYPEHGRPSWGVTDADGHYTLTYVRDGDGAVTGTHKVWVQFRPSSPKEEADYHNGVLKLHPQMKDILAKYGKQETTPLTVVVKEDNQVTNLALD